MNDNACRYDARAGGHVESYFWRLNDPVRPRAMWLKATIFAPLEGAPLAETWCIWFDGERNRTWAHRATQPLVQSAFPDAYSNSIRVSGATFEAGQDGKATGKLERDGESCAWDLSWSRERGPIADPLSLLPSHAMIDGPFPRSKTLTPFPSVRFKGSVTCFGEEVEIADWVGMQGHNWGREHASEYAWGQCLFEGTGHDPDAMVEGFTARVKVGRFSTPLLSSVVVRRGSDTFRFDRLLDFWRQEAEIGDLKWSVKLTGPEGVVRLEMEAGGRPMVCLGYRNPDGRMSYCFNSKLAKTRLRVEPHHGAPFSYASEHGGALELLKGKPDIRFPDIV